MSTTITERATERWVADPSRSTVEFRVRTFWGVVTVAGEFTDFSGTYTDGPDGRAIELEIDARTVDTHHDTRDKHLRGEDFFDVDAHPFVRFTSDEIVDRGDGTLRIDGELEAAGERVPLSFDATLSADGDEREFEATTAVNQRLLGMTHSPLPGMIRPPATLHVRARLVPASDS
jgi:polyisoprenoid-binding protein YceI